MTKEFSKGDFLYMQLTSWLLEHFRGVYDDYQLNAFEEHNQKWLDYEEVKKNDL